MVVVKRQLRFRECGESLLGNRFPLKMKGSLLLLRKISNTVPKRGMVFKRE